MATNMADDGHLGFLDAVLTLDTSFHVALKGFYTKGNLCIMI